MNPTIDKKTCIKIYKGFEDLRYLLFLFSLIFGIALFANYFFAINMSTFSYKIGISFPGFLNFESHTRLFIYNFVVILIHIALVISSIGSFYDNRYCKMLLASIWGLLSFGLEFWVFRWWPTLNFDFNPSLTFDLFGIDFGIKLNLITSFLFLWAIISDRNLRKEFIKGI